MAIEVINPANGEIIQTYEEMTWEEIESILGKYAKSLSKVERNDFCRTHKKNESSSEASERWKEKYARLMADEMGKPLAQGKS